MADKKPTAKAGLKEGDQVSVTGVVVGRTDDGTGVNVDIGDGHIVTLNKIQQEEALASRK